MGEFDQGCLTTKQLEATYTMGCRTQGLQAMGAICPKCRQMIRHPTDPCCVGSLAPPYQLRTLCWQYFPISPWQRYFDPLPPHTLPTWKLVAQLPLLPCSCRKHTSHSPSHEQSGHSSNSAMLPPRVRKDIEAGGRSQKKPAATAGTTEGEYHPWGNPWTSCKLFRGHQLNSPGLGDCYRLLCISNIGLEFKKWKSLLQGILKWQN